MHPALECYLGRLEGNGGPTFDSYPAAESDGGHGDTHTVVPAVRNVQKVFMFMCKL